MGISQYHVNYSQDEDRVYIFVRDDEGTEHAFGVTRRLFKRLWPALGKAVQEMSDSARKAAEPLKGEVLDIERQGAVSEARTSGALSDAPLAKAGKRLEYLTAVVQLQDGGGGGKVLRLTDGKKVISIPMNYERLLVFCDALKSIVENSDWDLEPAYPWAGARKDADDPVPAAPEDESPTRH